MLTLALLALATSGLTTQGFDQILIDYVHERNFPIIGPIAKWTLRLLTGTVLVGVYQFNTNDVGESLSRGSERAKEGGIADRIIPGITELIKKGWKA